MSEPGITSNFKSGFHSYYSAFGHPLKKIFYSNFTKVIFQKAVVFTHLVVCLMAHLGPRCFTNPISMRGFARSIPFFRIKMKTPCSVKFNLFDDSTLFLQK